MLQSTSTATSLPWQLLQISQRLGTPGWELQAFWDEGEVAIPVCIFMSVIPVWLWAAMAGSTFISLQMDKVHSRAQLRWERMQKGNVMGKVWKMKGRASHMAANTCEAPHRQRKGGRKGRRGLVCPSYLAFPISPRDFPLSFPFLLKVSLPLFDFRLSNFFDGSGCVSHFGEANTSSKEAVPTTHGYPGDLFFPQGHWLRARSSQRNPLFLLQHPRKGHGSAPAPAAPIAREQESRVHTRTVPKCPQPHTREQGAARKSLLAGWKPFSLAVAAREGGLQTQLGRRKKIPGRGKKMESKIGL